MKKPLIGSKSGQGVAVVVRGAVQAQSQSVCQCLFLSSASTCRLGYTVRQKAKEQQKKKVTQRIVFGHTQILFVPPFIRLFDCPKTNRKQSKHQQCKESKHERRKEKRAVFLFCSVCKRRSEASVFWNGPCHCFSHLCTSRKSLRFAHIS